MARDSKEQRDIKIKALNEALGTLKEESTATGNLVTFDKVIAYANELYSDKLDRNISPTSIKSPTSKEFKAIKQSIEDYREEHKRIKGAAPKKALSEVTKLKKTIENLMIQIAEFHDDKLLLNETLQAKERTIEKLKKERDILHIEIDKLKD